MTPERGAELWSTYIEPLKAQGMRLGTPAPSSAPSGKTWLQEWLQTCNGGCNPDFVALRKLRDNKENLRQAHRNFLKFYRLVRCGRKRLHWIP